MKTYARIWNGFVVELITTDLDINEQFHADFVSNLVDVTAASPEPQYGWTATQSGSQWTFSVPVPSMVSDQL